MRRAHELASAAMKKTALKYKARYDKRVRDHALETGDRVLVKNVGLKGPHKLADRWSKTVYRVRQRLSPDIPVYVVEPIDDDGPRKTLHRNMLLPCGFVPSCEDEPSVRKRPQPKPRLRRPQRRPLPTPPSDMDDALDSDISDDNFYVLRPVPAKRQTAPLNPGAPIFIPVPSIDEVIEVSTPTEESEPAQGSPSPVSDESMPSEESPTDNTSSSHPSSDDTDDKKTEEDSNSEPSNHVASGTTSVDSDIKDTPIPYPRRNRKPPQYYGFEGQNAKLLEQHLAMQQKALEVTSSLISAFYHND